MKRLTLLLSLALAALAAALPAAASAHDRDRDRMSDRWEKRHHLNTHRNDARRDADHDGLKNVGEFRTGNDPRDADTDNDGVEDGEENAGTIKSFDGTTLTITTAHGEVSGTVNDATELECEGPGDDDRARTARSGDDDEADREDGDDDGDDDDTCAKSALVPGASVHEAELEGGVFEEVELRV